MSLARPPRVTVVGDALLDVDWLGSVERIAPDGLTPILDSDSEVRRPGGAGLAARCAAEAGAEVTLVTALGDDDEGDQVRTALAAAGVDVVDLGLAGRTPTKLRLRTAAQSVARVDRHCSPVAAVGAWTEHATAAIERSDALLVSDYGRRMAATPALAVLVHQNGRRRPVVWDPHPRGPRPPAGRLDLLTPNLAEAIQLVSETYGHGRNRGPTATLRLAARLRRQFDCAVCVTTGDQGAVLAEPGSDPLLVPVAPATGDPCGAGDRFAATVAVERAKQTDRVDAVRRAVEAARRHVSGLGPVTAAGGADTGRLDAVALAASVRRDGGIVVAAGGCFDVLHAGHVRLLDAARRLGDCLIICLNDDRSVRRLKGRMRPVNPLEDRIAVLSGLGCVDAVHVFAEDTPAAALRELEPHLFVKGADHADRYLPERPVMAAWGGRVVLLPVLEGRSTTRILHAAAS